MVVLATSTATRVVFEELWKRCLYFFYAFLLSPLPFFSGVTNSSSGWVCLVGNAAPAWTIFPPSHENKEIQRA